MSLLETYATQKSLPLGLSSTCAECQLKTTKPKLVNRSTCVQCVGRDLMMEHLIVSRLHELSVKMAGEPPKPPGDLVLTGLNEKKVAEAARNYAAEQDKFKIDMATWQSRMDPEETLKTLRHELILREGKEMAEPVDIGQFLIVVGENPPLNPTESLTRTILSQVDDDRARRFVELIGQNSNLFEDEQRPIWFLKPEAATMMGGDFVEYYLERQICCPGRNSYRFSPLERVVCRLHRIQEIRGEMVSACVPFIPVVPHSNKRPLVREISLKLTEAQKEWVTRHSRGAEAPVAGLSDFVRSAIAAKMAPDKYNDVDPEVLKKIAQLTPDGQVTLVATMRKEEFFRKQKPPEKDKVKRPQKEHEKKSAPSSPRGQPSKEETEKKGSEYFQGSKGQKRSIQKAFGSKKMVDIWKVITSSLGKGKYDPLKAMAYFESGVIKPGTDVSVAKEASRKN